MRLHADVDSEEPTNDCPRDFQSQDGGHTSQCGAASPREIPTFPASSASLAYAAPAAYLDTE